MVGIPIKKIGMNLLNMSFQVILNVQAIEFVDGSSGIVGSVMNHLHHVRMFGFMNLIP